MSFYDSVREDTDVVARLAGEDGVAYPGDIHPLEGEASTFLTQVGELPPGFASVLSTGEGAGTMPAVRTVTPLGADPGSYPAATTAASSKLGGFSDELLLDPAATPAARSKLGGLGDEHFLDVDKARLASLLHVLELLAFDKKEGDLFTPAGSEQAINITIAGKSLTRESWAFRHRMALLEGPYSE